MTQLEEILAIVTFLLMVGFVVAGYGQIGIFVAVLYVVFLYIKDKPLK